MSTLAIGIATERSVTTQLKDSLSLSRVGQHFAIGMATERSVTTRLKDSPASGSRGRRRRGCRRPACTGRFSGPGENADPGTVRGPRQPKAEARPREQLAVAELCEDLAAGCRCCGWLRLAAAVAGQPAVGWLAGRPQLWSAGWLTGWLAHLVGDDVVVRRFLVKDTARTPPHTHRTNDSVSQAHRTTESRRGWRCKRVRQQRRRGGADRSPGLASVRTIRRTASSLA